MPNIAAYQMLANTLAELSQNEFKMIGSNIKGSAMHLSAIFSN